MLVTYVLSIYERVINHRHVPFRVIKLKNGLTALLIADLNPPHCPNYENNDKGKRNAFILKKL